jgi:hypothetical protein
MESLPSSKQASEVMAMKRPLTLEQRKELGERAVEQVAQLFRDLGFGVERVGVEHRYSEAELAKLRRRGELPAEERFAPDLEIRARLEVKFVRDLENPLWAIRQWLHQIRLEHEGVHLIYVFVDEKGDCRLIPAKSLKPEVIFFHKDEDRDWLVSLFPGVKVKKLSSCRGSGEPFARVSLPPKRPAIYCHLRTGGSKLKLASLLKLALA